MSPKLNWKSAARFKVVRLWDTRAQRGRQPRDDEERERWKKDAGECAYDPGDERAQKEIAAMLCPARYHDRWYEPPAALAPFADDLAGGVPLLIHRRRVPDEAEQWLTWRDNPSVLGPRVWMCIECSRGLRPGMSPDGTRAL
eukprot:gene52060-9103_t